MSAPLFRSLVAASLALALALVSESQGQVLSPKRGFADVGANYNILQATNAGWYYGWRPDKPGGVGNFDAEFVPMIWGTHQANQTEINNILSYGDVEWVLGFNEPERPDQANTSVANAVAAWRTLSAGFTGTDVKLVSPGVADTGGADGGQQWLSDFMTQVNAEGLKIDGVAFHWYGVADPNNPVGAASSFLSRVDSYHNSYGLPVWVTEFGIIDWGGAYTDEQMREANAIFLEHVIPGLESRSHVAGYAFYQWTGDTTLVEGNPLTPTNVGRNYVGAIGPGQSYDHSPVDHGEHVAYLAGGELTSSGSGAGALRYINAIEGASSITGAVDWGLSSGNWLRVQAGASLRKTGGNTISVTGGSVTNNGVIEVDAGVLRVTNGGSIGGSGVTRVNPNGTLDLSAPFSSFFLGAGQTIDNHGGSVVGDIFATPGSTLAGEGVYQGLVVLQSGAQLRVGGQGIATASQALIDDFDAYDNSFLNNIGAHPSGDVTGGVWDGVFDGTNNGQVVDNSAPGDNALQAFGVPGQGAGGWRGAVTDLSGNFASDHGLAHSETATYFFQVMNEGNAFADTMIGLTESKASLDSNDAWTDFAVMPYVAGAAGAASLRVYGDNIGDQVVAPLTDGQWRNVWLVVDNQDKSFDVYTSTGTDVGVLAISGVEFGRITDPLNLEAFGIAGREDGRVRIDNLYRLEGENTSNPLVNPGNLSFAGETLTIDGALTVQSGAVVTFDIATTGVNDRLVVDGALSAAGTLDIVLDAEAPSLAEDDTFDLLDVGSVTGAFTTINLPTLTPGLVWDISGLYLDGVVTVVAGLAGDYNGDGMVDAADYTVWRDNEGQDPTALAAGSRNPHQFGPVGQADYNFWVEHFGESLQSGFSSTVPEPQSLTLILPAVVATLRRRVRG